MRIDEDLAAVAAFAEAGQFDDVRKHVDPKWVREALEATGTATVRRRRLPAEQVVWLVIGMAIYLSYGRHHSRLESRANESAASVAGSS